jgi:hypothetical protein
MSGLDLIKACSAGSISYYVLKGEPSCFIHIIQSVPDDPWTSKQLFRPHATHSHLFSQPHALSVISGAVQKKVLDILDGATVAIAPGGFSVTESV